MLGLLNAVPAPARYFGLAGLLPFFAAAIACWFVPKSGFLFGAVTAQFILCAYGAVILSFLGGIRWGVAMQYDGGQLSDGQSDSRQFEKKQASNVQNRMMMNDWWVVGLAMVPSLIAWPALLLSPSVGIPMVIVGLLLQYFIDFRSSKAALTPQWFLTLRTLLTLGAVFSLLLGWFAP